MMASISIGIRSIGMSSIGQRRVNTRVEKGSISLRLSISRPLAKMVVGSKGVRGGTIGVGCAITVGEGSMGIGTIGQRRINTIIQQGGISLRLGFGLSAGNSNQCGYNNKEFHVDFFGSSDLA